MTHQEITEIAEKTADILERRGLVRKTDRDYTVADIIAITGYSSHRISSLTLHGQYYIAGKRMFKKSEIDYRMKNGMQLAVGWK